MEFISHELNQYCEGQTSTESTLLHQLNRDTHLKVLSPRMLSGHLQGRFLSMISHMIRPSYILEIGTYTGYSALCLAEGLIESGQLVSLDINEETSEMAQHYINQSAFKDKIHLKVTDAKSFIPGITTPIDIVFIDADKQNYSLYYDLVFDKVKSGGYILADNVLWSGKITMPEDQMDKSTKAIHEFNKKIQSDSRVENILLPLRDGIMMVRKK